MKKELVKKIIAGMLAMVMCISITACGNSNDTNKQITVYPETTDAEPLTIGYTFWDITFDPFAKDQANQIKLVADALNVNLLFNPNNEDFSAESVVRAAEGFADQGVDGMIVINFSEESLLRISDICEEGQIPFMQATRTISDETVAKQVESNPYYVGRIHESEYAAAYEVGRRVIEKGAKNIILLSAEHGDASYEARAEGFRDACEEPDVSIIEEVWELTEEQAAKEATIELLQKHPEADGVFVVRGALFSGVISAQEELGMTSYLPVGRIDFDLSLGDSLEKGTITAAAGGHQADASLTLITLVNAIRGAYDKSIYPIDIYYNMTVIDSVEEFEDYKYWCVGYEEDYDNRQFLNANDARGLCVDFNPDTTLDALSAFIENLTVERVRERHEPFIEQNK